MEFAGDDVKLSLPFPSVLWTQKYPLSNGNKRHSSLHHDKVQVDILIKLGLRLHKIINILSATPNSCQTSCL